MESVHGKHKSSKFASKDIISSMPKIVITNILDRLPIQEVVKTSILARNWRYKWTMLSQLIFDVKFFEYLLRTKGEKLFYRRSLSRILLHIKGFITKFVLYIPQERYSVLDVEDINHWILFLSTKGMKEFVLINMRKVPLKLPTHIFSCLELSHMRLHNCHFHHLPSYHGFPNLSSFDFHMVKFESCTYGEFITQCPLLENLKIEHSISDIMGKVKPIELATLENLKVLSLSLCKLDSMAITCSGIVQLFGFLPKLEELDLDFRNCKFFVESGVRKRVNAALPSLKTIRLGKLDLSNRIMALCAFDLIHGSPNLHTLRIKVAYEVCVSPLWSWDWSWEVNNYIMGKLQLQLVELEYIRGSEIELCLIKALLAYSFLLKKMVINHKTPRLYAGCHGNYTFARKLLKLHRASPIAEIDLH